LVFAPGSWQLKTFPKTSHFNPWEKAMFPAFSSDSSAGSGENERKMSEKYQAPPSAALLSTS
jgi:hypothetical protein